MYDLHNHILPGIDDGASDLQESLIMARTAVSVGTTVMAATPHRFYQGREMTVERVEESVQVLQSQLDTQNVPLRIVPGVEIGMRPDTVDALRAGRLSRIGGQKGKFALIEPPFEELPDFCWPIIEGVLALSITPILAHPERNATIQKDLAFPGQCAARGVIIQLTAGSIVGKFGAKAQACAQRIALNRGWKIIIGSDAHDAYDRTPGDLADAADRVAGWIGDASAARVMVDDLPASLLPS
jgi:protein-tyrosine phosphatase